MFKSPSPAASGLIALAVICLILAACGARDDGATDEAKGETGPVANQEPVSAEMNETQDGSTIDTEALAEGEYASPMPELDSVADVIMTPPEHEQAAEQAVEQEKRGKAPKKPEPRP